MRISFVVPGDIETGSGGYLYDRMMRSHLLRSGDYVRVFTLDDFDEKIDHLADLINEEDPDIILQDKLGFGELTVLNGSLNAEIGSKIVSLVHNPTSILEHDLEKRKEIARSERSYLKSVDGIIYNSATTLSDISNLTGIVKPYVVANPGKDHIKYTEKEVKGKGEGIKILSVCNLVRNKGIMETLDALNSIGSEEWTLMIVGRNDVDREYLYEVMDRIAAFGLEDRIELLGHRDHDQLSEIYARSDIFLSTSFYEGWGMSNVEAMGFGIPLVTTSIGATREYVDDGIEGFLVDPNNARGISSRLKDLIRSGKLRSKMGKNGVKRFGELPTWERSMRIARNFMLDVSR